MKPKPGGSYSEGTFNSRGSLNEGHVPFRGPYAAEAYREAGYLKSEDAPERRAVRAEREQRERMKRYEVAKQELAAKRASDADHRFDA